MRRPPLAPHFFLFRNFDSRAGTAIRSAGRRARPTPSDPGLYRREAGYARPAPPRALVLTEQPGTRARPASRSPLAPAIPWPCPCNSEPRPRYLAQHLCGSPAKRTETPARPVRADSPIAQLSAIAAEQASLNKSPALGVVFPGFFSKPITIYEPSEASSCARHGGGRS